VLLWNSCLTRRPQTHHPSRSPLVVRCTSACFDARLIIDPGILDSPLPAGFEFITYLLTPNSRPFRSPAFALEGTHRKNLMRYTFATPFLRRAPFEFRHLSAFSKTKISVSPLLLPVCSFFPLFSTGENRRASEDGLSRILLALFVQGG